MIKNSYTFFTLLALIVFVFTLSVHANSSSIYIDPQSASWLGSNNSQIQIFSESLEYHNRGNNSSVVGNYFIWTYYDSIYWNFQMNWSSNIWENVRIVGTTSACWIWDYGYKLWGYAYSPVGWFIDFDYNDSTFVYYCNSDQSLRGYAYSSHIWLQNFTWIEFDIEYIDQDEVEIPVLTEEVIWPESQITSPPIQTGPTGWFPTPPANPTPNIQAIQSQPFRFNGQTIEFIPENESFFYIIK